MQVCSTSRLYISNAHSFLMANDMMELSCPSADFFFSSNSSTVYFFQFCFVHLLFCKIDIKLLMSFSVTSYSQSDSNGEGLKDECVV